jgi:hypothetical protein
MRLARLRSWVLRQRLPDGQRLPDPYAIMRDPAYMVQPGVYRQKGTDPRSAASWVQLAKEGRPHAAGFVRALTLIFQKRGYKWDDIALEEMSDARLKDFLQTARIPTDDPTLVEQIRTQIERRKQFPDDPFRGKNRVKPEDLEAYFQLACERGKLPPRPRIAEHRSIKEADLRGVVDGFAGSCGIRAEQADCWKRELCTLLNKVLRPTRFENRLKAGCAWCGKATPRKAKVRALAYRAAVPNLRAREGFRARPLREDERKVFFEWWADPQSAPGVDAIAKRLAKINPEQKGMARQFYDLLKNEKPKGRASLCVEHLKLAAEGKTMKDAGVDWQNIAVRKAPNPCRERRDERVLRRLGQILFKPGVRGEQAWRFGRVQYISLEIPEPDTERVPKGKQTERQEKTLVQRLIEETDGCIYKVLAGCGGETDKDHIFPRALGGPDVRVNLVAACMIHNKEKGSQTPYRWLGGDDGKWGAFENHVEKLKISERKKRILLNKTEEYPEGDPTSFARVGAPPRQFVVSLRKLFQKYGVTPPRHDYHVGEPLIQRIGGRETNHFRLSWWKKADGSENFPYPKDRSTLFNHAEDAAILAAIPPHTWKERALCYSAERPNRNGEWKPRPGLAIPDLAPDWAGFLSNRKQPLTRILGSYPVNWKTQFADLTFWREPQLDTPRLKRFKLLKDIQRKDFNNIVSPSVRSMVEDIAASVGLGEKRTIAEALARQIAGEGAKRSVIEQELPRAVEELQKRYPGLRRVQISSQKGGTPTLVAPLDGPIRKVQIKPGSEGAIIWQQGEGKKKKKTKTHISLIRPRPLQKFDIPRVDPPIPSHANILGQFHRHEIIWLDGLPDRPAGFYRLAKFQHGAVTAMPEEAVPAEILRRLKIKRETEENAAEAGQKGGEEASEAMTATSLGRQELAEYFSKKASRNAT